MNHMSLDQSRKVSIAIPTLNRQGYLRLAVESALAQSYGNLEVIVSDNVSSDATWTYLTSLSDSRLKIMRQSHKLSMVDNWNCCVKAATGSFFLLLSDDDLLRPNAIASLVSAYEDTDSSSIVPGIVYCGGEVIDSQGKRLWPVEPAPPLEGAKELILGSFRGKRNVLLCSILFRTSDLGEGFPAGFDIVNDAAMWMSILIRYGHAIHIPEQLIQYRVHDRNLSFETPSSVWITEMTNLAKLVLQNLSEDGSDSHEFAASLQRAIEENNRRHVPLWIKRLLGRRVAALLREYSHKVAGSGPLAGVRNIFRRD